MVLRIGHRGAMGYAPENTLLSFQKALDLHVDMIELDVYVCLSGDLVVIHDDKVDRTTNGKGYVMQKTLSELRSLDAGQGEKIPLLQEVLDLIDRKTKVNIELKGTGTAKPVHDMIEHYVTTRGWSHDDFLVSSFHHYELMTFKKINPHISLGALFIGIPIGYAAFAEQMGVQAINPCVEFIDKMLVDDAHKRGMQVYVWTVNDPDEIQRVKELGVDGIFSNFPDRI